MLTLLYAEELRNAAYREIAKAAGVALGTVGSVVTEFERQLFAPLRLRKKPDGSLELRRQFWEFEYPEKKLGIAPPLLIYADLIAVGDPRNIEAVEMIYDESLTRYFGKA